MYSNESREVTEERDVARGVIIAMFVGLLMWGAFAILLPYVAHAQSTECGDQPNCITITRHRVVTSSTLPHCVNEDGSGSPLPCTWNIGTERDGNGKGLAYMAYHRPGSSQLHYLYLWNYNPAGYDGWHWSKKYPTCVIRTHDRSAVVWPIRCPNGRDPR